MFYSPSDFLNKTKASLGNLKNKKNFNELVFTLIEKYHTEMQSLSSQQNYPQSLFHIFLKKALKGVENLTELDNRAALINLLKISLGQEEEKEPEQTLQNPIQNLALNKNEEIGEKALLVSLANDSFADIKKNISNAKNVNFSINHITPILVVLLRNKEVGNPFGIIPENLDYTRIFEEKVAPLTHEELINTIELLKAKGLDTKQLITDLIPVDLFAAALHYPLEVIQRLDSDLTDLYTKEYVVDSRKILFNDKPEIFSLISLGSYPTSIKQFFLNKLNEKQLEKLLQLLRFRELPDLQSLIHSYLTFNREIKSNQTDILNHKLQTLKKFRTLIAKMISGVDVSAAFIEIQSDLKDIFSEENFLIISQILLQDQELLAALISSNQLSIDEEKLNEIKQTDKTIYQIITEWFSDKTSSLQSDYDSLPEKYLTEIYNLAHLIDEDVLSLNQIKWLIQFVVNNLLTVDIQASPDNDTLNNIINLLMQCLECLGEETSMPFKKVHQATIDWERPLLPITHILQAIYDNHSSAFIDLIRTGQCWHSLERADVLLAIIQSDNLLFLNVLMADSFDQWHIVENDYPDLLTHIIEKNPSDEMLTCLLNYIPKEAASLSFLVHVAKRNHHFLDIKALPFYYDVLCGLDNSVYGQELEDYELLLTKLSKLDDGRKLTLLAHKAAQQNIAFILDFFLNNFDEDNDKRFPFLYLAEDGRAKTLVTTLIEHYNIKYAYRYISRGAELPEIFRNNNENNFLYYIIKDFDRFKFSLNSLLKHLTQVNFLFLIEPTQALLKKLLTNLTEELTTRRYTDFTSMVYSQGLNIDYLLEAVITLLALYDKDTLGKDNLAMLNLLVMELITKNPLDALAIIDKFKLDINQVVDERTGFTFLAQAYAYNQIGLINALLERHANYDFIGNETIYNFFIRESKTEKKYVNQLICQLYRFHSFKAIQSTITVIDHLSPLYNDDFNKIADEKVEPISVTLKSSLGELGNRFEEFYRDESIKLSKKTEVFNQFRVANSDLVKLLMLRKTYMPGLSQYQLKGLHDLIMLISQGYQFFPNQSNQFEAEINPKLQFLISKIKDNHRAHSFLGKMNLTECGIIKALNSVINETHLLKP